VSFPEGFVWGAAASSYQIEGAAQEDGKGLSIWDTFCQKTGTIWNGQSGDTACDHYHRYEEDVSLMKQIGLQAYRLSVSWPHVVPQGTGPINPKGLEFYDRLTDKLLAAGISPYVTLFHWDYPDELYRRGGWLNRDSSDWFAEYVKVVVEKLSDRVKYWITLNEPQCFIGLGHQFGFHAPGDKLELAEVLTAAHNALLAHGKAVQTIRSYSKIESRIGLALVGIVNIPATDSSEDVEAARHTMFSITSKNCWNNTWWTEPVFPGRYPEDGLELFGSEAPQIQNKDMKTICQPLDFLGVNIYFGQRTRASKDGQPEAVPFPVGHAMTAFRFPVSPEALYWGPRFLWERYQLPIIITENGMSNVDWASLDGKVHDPQRIDFLHRYLLELQRACKHGVEVHGYFQWSILDNFEWTEGYKERYGLVYVDYPTQKRILKDSAYWYKEVIATNGATLGKL
jgi:beta-glucosidase